MDSFAAQLGVCLALGLLAILASGCAQQDGTTWELDTEAVTYPTVDLTTVPALGSHDPLVGRVYGAPPASHRVAVYIRVGGGWWSKPAFAEPLTPIAADRTFTCDITTGDGDANATRIAAYLLPAGQAAPLARGEASLPGALASVALASAEWVRTAQANFRVIRFSGREWAVKSSGGQKVGPGPNYFSDSALHVWVDDRGRLHLRLAKRDGRWTCAEVVLRESLGHGKYIWSLDSPVDALDPRIILGLFTWDDDPADNHREIDLEFARWGNAADPTNAQYVVQPYETPGNLKRFVQPGVARSTHAFRWAADRIFFKSVQGPILNPSDPALTIGTWTYRGGDIPSPGNENTRMNLWLMQGQAPATGKGAEVIIRSFRHQAEP